MYFPWTDRKSARDPEVILLDTGRVLNIRNIVPMVLTDQSIRKMNDWCNNSKRDKHERRL